MAKGYVCIGECGKKIVNPVYCILSSIKLLLTQCMFIFHLEGLACDKTVFIKKKLFDKEHHTQTFQPRKKKKKEEG